MGVTAHVLFYFIDGRMIMADTFHLYDGEGNETMEGLAGLLDFGD